MPHPPRPRPGELRQPYQHWYPFGCTHLWRERLVGAVAVIGVAVLVGLVELAMPGVLRVVFWS